MKGQKKTDAPNDRWGDLKKEPPSAGRPTLEEGGFVNGAANVGSVRGCSSSLGAEDDEYDSGSSCGGEARVTARGTLEDWRGGPKANFRTPIHIATVPARTKSRRGRQRRK